MYKSMLAALFFASLPVAAHAAPRALVPGEGQIEFIVKEMGVPVSGSFKRFDAAVDIDPVKPENSSVLLRIDIGSLSTGNDEADALAAGPDWLDKVHAPFATFKSSAIRELGRGRYEALGTLSIRNRERSFVIQFSAADQADGKTLVASEFTIKRADFAIGGGEWNQGGVVAPEVLVKVKFALAPATARGGVGASRPS
jgi:polyisoprenoid-binding protein YceI